MGTRLKRVLNLCGRGVPVGKIESLQRENKMGVLPVNRLLVTMSIPMVVSMLVQALYNVVDSMFVAQINENALTAVSLAFPVQNLMIAVGTGTGVGVNALLSKSLGQRDFEKANKAANHAVLLAACSYIVFALLGISLSRWFFEVQTDVQEIIDYGTSYLIICCTFSFGMFGQFAFERLLQSTGKTFYTMITQGTGAIINIIFDPILIFGLLGFPKMGVAGAAAATVLGQIVAAILAIVLNHYKNDEIRLSLKKFRPEWKIIRQIYSVGVPSIIMGAIGSVMTFGMNEILIAFSTTATAVFGVYFKLQSFAFMPVFGLNNGMVPIVAYNFGARKPKRMMKTIWLSIGYAVGIMAIAVIIAQTIPDKLLLIFNASDNMMEIGIPALRIISLGFLFAGFDVIIGSVLQALSHGFMSLSLSLLRQLVVLLPVAYLLSLTGRLELIWWAFPLSEVASAALSAVYFVVVRKKDIKTIDPSPNDK